jgi:hypothetical protein
MIRQCEACRISVICHGFLASISMVLAFICYIIRKIYESSFQHNKRCIIWTSELGVMAILVEDVHAVGGCARMNEDSSDTPLTWPFTCFYLCLCLHLTRRNVSSINKLYNPSSERELILIWFENWAWLFEKPVV